MSRASLACVLGALLPLGMSGSRIGDARDQATIVHVQQPIIVQGTLLQPGDYEFRRMAWPVNREVVQIWDESHRLVATKLAQPTFRFGVTNETRFTFYEAPPDEPPALRTWFSPGYHYGFRFAER
jgi:hypothetical protein